MSRPLKIEEGLTVQLVEIRDTSNITLLKADLLCYGVRISPEARASALNKYFPLLTEKEIHGAHLALDGGSVVNVVFGEDFAERSPYVISCEDGEWWLCKESRRLVRCSLLPEPTWYRRSTHLGVQMSRIFRLHGTRVLFDASYVKCDYVDKGEPCLFCSFARDRVKEEWKVSQVAETVAAALEENPDYQIGLSDGVRATLDESVTYFSSMLREIRRVAPDVPVSVEMVAPDRLDVIDRIVEAGATAVIMNLEFYDERIRRIFCPAKSRVARSTYFRAWEYGVERLGKGQVSSVLIAGLEREELTIEGARLMVDRGVIPTIMPFRPYDNTPLKNMRVTDSAVFIRIEGEVARLLRASGLNPYKQGGCTSCGACSLEIDYCS